MARLYRSVFLFCLFLVCAFNFADRAVFAVLAQSIRVDLKLTDFEPSWIQVGFGVLYACMGGPFGRARRAFQSPQDPGDRHGHLVLRPPRCAEWRRTWCSSWQRAPAWGSAKPASSRPRALLVADHFPARRRATAMSFVMLGTPVGTFLGSLIAGWVAAEYGWRHAFYALGIPGIVVAVLVYAVLKEPRRGLVDNEPRTQRPVPNFGAFVSTVIHRRAVALSRHRCGLRRHGDDLDLLVPERVPAA